MKIRPNFIILFFALASTALFWPAGRNAKAQTDNGAAQTSTQTAAENSSSSSAVNVITYHNDIGRTGRNLAEKILTTSNVKSSTFGKVGFLTVDGLVDAEPLYVSNLSIGGSTHNVVFVVTELDSVYAFDADTYAPLWQVTALGAGESPSDNRGCGQVTPNIGITSTPVIKLGIEGKDVMYLIAMSKDTNGNYYQRLHALDITSGAEISGSPVTIQATFPNLNGQTTFDPKQYKERAALLFLDGQVFTSWASHCDNPPYTGWVLGYNATTLKQETVLNVTPNGSDGAIWMAGAGLASDGEGNIFLLDANGTFDDTLNSSGFPINGDYGNGFLKLSTKNNKLAVADYFNMYNTNTESNQDEDLGSGGVLVLPNLQDASNNVWQLAVGAGKDGNIYLVNRNLMGKFNTQNDDGIYQEIDNALGGGVWAMPAYFKNTIYYGAQGDTLKAFSIVNAKLVAAPASQSSVSFAYPGTTPSISANQASQGIVWAVENHGGGAGVLHAYEASNLTIELYNSSQAGSRDSFSDNKFVTPMIANGKVFVGTPTGVIVFGLLP
jgi:hypothetical protein